MSHEVNCGYCNEVIVLLKDSTEGQQVFHGGECFNKYKESQDMINNLPKTELPPVQELTARNEFKCQCGYLIQKSGKYWRIMTKTESGVYPECVCFKCKEIKGM